MVRAPDWAAQALPSRGPSRPGSPAVSSARIPPRQRARLPRCSGPEAPSPQGRRSPAVPAPSRPAAVPARTPSALRPAASARPGPAAARARREGRHAEQPLPRPGALTLQGLEDRLRHLGAAAAVGDGAGLRKHCGNRGGGGGIGAARGRPGASAEPPAPETQLSLLSARDLVP